jgi:hypothetical protein
MKTTFTGKMILALCGCVAGRCPFLITAETRAFKICCRHDIHSARLTDCRTPARISAARMPRRTLILRRTFSECAESARQLPRDHHGRAVQKFLTMTPVDVQLAKIEALARLLTWLRFQPRPQVNELADEVSREL